MLLILFFLGGWGGADGRDDFPVCRLCLKEVSRTGQDPSAGTTLPCKSENKQTNKQTTNPLPQIFKHPSSAGAVMAS